MNEIPLHQKTKCPSFSKAEFIKAIDKCCSLSTLGPNQISWSHLKALVNHDKCLDNIVNIENSCIDLRYWPCHFKKSMSIIILKPNKPFYNTLEIFQPIVLLNTLGKLIEKVISVRLQVYSITLNFIHPSQISSIRQQSTTDTSIYLTHLIYMEWIKSLYMSTLNFNTTQFFLLLNYQLFLKILSKTSFDS